MLTLLEGGRKEGGLGFDFFERKRGSPKRRTGVRAAIEAAGFHSLFILLCREGGGLQAAPPSAFMKNSLGNAVLQFYKLPMEYFSFVRGCDLNFSHFNFIFPQILH